LWTYEPRQGRNAATVVCSAYAVVALAPPFFQVSFLCLMVSLERLDPSRRLL